MTSPKNIYSIGQELSPRYAHDQQYLDPESSIELGKRHPSSMIDVNIPCLESEVDRLFETGRANKSMARFVPPAQYTSRHTSNFSHFIVPSLGNEEKVDVYRQKLDDMINVSERTVDDKNELELEKTEQGKVMEFLDCYQALNGNNTFISNARNSTKRG